MRRRIDVCRRRAGETTSYHEVFVFETDDDQSTVASALRAINGQDTILTEEGKETTPIQWELSCLQKKCGACAMVISGTPRLACTTKLADLADDPITLEPLHTFACVADLIVDRQTMFDNLSAATTWLEGEADLADKRWPVAMEASRCLQCGICLEVCPNFSCENAFSGMAQMVPLARLLAETPKDERKRLARSWKDHVYGGCGKSLACRDVCPAKIDIGRLMARSNAAVLWHRW